MISASWPDAYTVLCNEALKRGWTKTETHAASNQWYAVRRGPGQDQTGATTKQSVSQCRTEAGVQSEEMKS